MPMHDWKPVPPTIYHHFHQRWTISICDALNAGLLPPGYSALVEQYSAGVYPDVLAVQRRGRPPSTGGGTAIASLPAPRTRMTVRAREVRLHERANRVAIRHHLADIVCAIEVVSPGNKGGRIAVRDFVDESVDFLKRGVNLLVVDPFPPGPHDPHTLHQLIWDRFDEGVPFDLPPDESLLLASYRAGDLPGEIRPTAYLEPFRVGVNLPDMPAWLDPDEYVNVPLEKTYRAAWDVCPSDFRQLVENGALPE